MMGMAVVAQTVSLNNVDSAKSLFCWYMKKKYAPTVLLSPGMVQNPKGSLLDRVVQQMGVLVELAIGHVPA
jgi:Gpi18-like mannosyltransferase